VTQEPLEGRLLHRHSVTLLLAENSLVMSLYYATGNDMLGVVNDDKCEMAGGETLVSITQSVSRFLLASD